MSERVDVTPLGFLRVEPALHGACDQGAPVAICMSGRLGHWPEPAACCTSRSSDPAPAVVLDFDIRAR